MKSIDMTTGSPTKKIILFSLPILLGNIFQQLYSLSDTLVVGRFLGKEALAAVGASSALVVLINSVMFGLCMGSSILFAKYYASKDTSNLSKAISTSVIFIGGFSLAVSVLTMLLLEPLLRIFQMPVESFQLSKDYLQIVLGGLFFLTLYNIASAVLRAKGDSKTPLIYLIVSTTINVVFDFIFVIYTPLGVKGPALSTLLAHIASSIPIVIYMLKSINYLKIKWVFDRLIFKEVWSYSVMTSLQQSIMNFGILLVQGLVNSFGVVAIAAFTIGVRIDSFAYMPAQDFGNAFSIFVSQNKGANLLNRIKSGFRSALLISTLFCGSITLVVLVFSKTWIGFFTQDDLEVIRLGQTYLRIEGLFYILIGYLFLFYALFRGLGEFKTSIVLTIVSLGTRVLLSYTLVYLGFGIESIFLSIPIGWLLADMFGFILFYRYQRQWSLL